METKDIQKIIDRAVGTEGILRIPSWWMHKILSDLVQYCDSLESSDAGIKEYLESQLNLVGDAVEALDARVSEVESHELFAIVSELPAEPKANTIYLVPSTYGEGNNILTEWVYINDAWEQFGEFKADVDLSGYVKKEDGKGLSANDYTDEDKKKVSSLENYDDTEIKDKLTELSEEINNYETKVTDITAAFEEEKTLLYKWGSTTYKWTENKVYYWRLYKVEAGQTLILRKKAERGTFMAVECDLADFVVDGKLGNLVIEQNAPLGDYTYDNTSADTKYIAVLYKYYSYIYFEVFLTATISIADKVRELEDAAKPITTERIVDGAVTIEKTDFVEVKPGAQLFDKATMAIDDAWYKFDSNFTDGIGGYAKFEVNKYTEIYTAIKIPMAKISNVVVSQPKGVVYSYFAVDADMRVLGYGIPNSSINTGMSIAIPDGCVYLLISAKSYVADSFMVNEGTEVLPYQEYGFATFVNGIKLTAQTEKKDVAKLYLPKVLHAVVGDTLQVFYRGLMSVVNPYGYDILLTCKKGKQFPRYFEYTPTTADIGEITFAVTLKDEDGNMLESKECKLVTKAAPSNVGAINIACFGDSLTINGTWCAEAYRRLSATNGNPLGLGLTNIKFVGKKTKNGAGYFGEGGWRWYHYVSEGTKAYRFEVSNVNSLSVGSEYTNNGSTFTIQEINVTNGSGNILCSVSGSNAPLASGTLTLSQGGGDSSISYLSYEIAPTNPLWDATNNKMSFIPYANEYADGQLDVVYVLLGWNDVHRESYPYPTMMANCKTFIDTLHAEFPNAKMKLMGLQVCSINGGMGANYGAGDDYSDTYGTIRRLMKLNLAYKELAESAEYSSFVEYVDIASQFDSEYNMPYAETKVNTRSSVTERRGTNGVHPSNDGYMQIADVVYRNIIANL